MDCLASEIPASIDFTDKMYTLDLEQQKKRYQLVGRSRVWHTYTQFIAVTVVYFGSRRFHNQIYFGWIRLSNDGWCSFFVFCSFVC